MFYCSNISTGIGRMGGSRLLQVIFIICWKRAQILRASASGWGLVDWCLLNFRTLKFHEYSGLAYYIHSVNNGYTHLRCREAPLHGNWRRPVKLAMMDNVGQCCLAASHQNQRYCSKARNDNSVRDYTQTCNVVSESRIFMKF
jgi:hypothetical protein